MAPKDRLPRYERPEMPFERNASPMAKAGRYAGAGFEFGISVVLFFLGGKVLDDYWGTTHPWMKVVGAFVGIVVGTWLLLRPLLADQGVPPRPPEDRPTKDRKPPPSPE